VNSCLVTNWAGTLNVDYEAPLFDVWSGILEYDEGILAMRNHEAGWRQKMAEGGPNVWVDVYK